MACKLARGYSTRQRNSEGARASAVKHRPADVISTTLIVQDKVANPLGQLFALPLALEPASALPAAFRGSRARCLDRVGRGTELVCGDMRNDCCLAGSVRGEPGCAAQRSRRGIG